MGGDCVKLFPEPSGGVGDDPECRDVPHHLATGVEDILPPGFS